MAVGKIYPH